MEIENTNQNQNNAKKQQNNFKNPNTQKQKQPQKQQTFQKRNNSNNSKPIKKQSMEIEQENKKQKSFEQIKKEKEQMKQFRQNLPIFKHRQDIVDKFKQNRVNIVAGETGCGKTTQIPQYILEESLNEGKIIAVTQPRRVAAITIAQRVAQEKNSQIGDLIGYSVRFEEKYTKGKTQLMYMTDGMLLRECIVDKNLSRFSTIIIDEAHERTINSDILLSMIKDLLSIRKDLKIIIMSATIETDKFANFYNSPENIIFLDGRCHPVDLYYTDAPQADYLESTMNTILQIHFTEPMGDILAFLTGQEDIDDLQQMLKEKCQMINQSQEKQLEVYTLYSALPSHLQLLAFQKQQDPNIRKVIISTNIAETSVTIDGIKYVIDCGLVKVRKYDANKMLEQLIVVPISKSSSMQRAGRAGRQQQGKCFRLYTENTHGTLSEYMPPEILRSNLSAVILQMKAIGIDNIEKFDFLDKPKPENLKSSLQILKQLNAINEFEQLTAHGKSMAELPLDPIFSNFMLASLEFNCTQEVISSISILSVENLFYFPQGHKKNLLKILQRFKTGQSDQLTKVHILYQYIEAQNKKSFCKENYLNRKTLLKAIQVRDQLLDYLKQIVEKRIKKMQNFIQNSQKNQLEKQQIETEIQKLQIKLAKALKFNPNIQQEEFTKCITKAMYLKVAKINIDGSYRILRTNQTAHIHPESLLFYQKPKPQCIVFNEVVFTSKTFLRDVTEIALADIQTKEN